MEQASRIRIVMRGPAVILPSFDIAPQSQDEDGQIHLRISHSLTPRYAQFKPDANASSGNS